MEKTLKKNLFIGFGLAIIIINLSHYNIGRRNGYTMPDGVNMKTIKQVGALISADVDTQNFQIANTLDGDTRAMPYRYVLEAQHSKTPLGVEKYPDAQALYVITREGPSEIVNSRVWEISSLGKSQVTQTWFLQNNIFMHKLEPITQI